MNSIKNLFLSAFLLSFGIINNEKGIAQSCYQDSDCKTLPANIPGSWKDTCTNPSIYCWQDAGQCMLSAKCLNWKKRPINTEVAAQHAMSCSKKGKQLINDNAFLKCK